MAGTGDMRLTATVHGRVQGVGFRAFVVDNAYNLGILGWVRNTFRGDVEVVAEGPRPSLERLLHLLESGPRTAHVTKVDVEWEAATGEFDRFSVEFG